jgi:hypothetical protein
MYRPRSVRSSVLYFLEIAQHDNGRYRYRHTNKGVVVIYAVQLVQAGVARDELKRARVASPVIPVETKQNDDWDICGSSRNRVPPRPIFA